LIERHEAGATTRIVKVKAHADVYGNEQADKHAKAATQMTSENATTINDPVDSTNIGFTWNKKPSGNEEEGTPLRLKEHVKFVLENEAIKTEIATNESSMATKWARSATKDGFLPYHTSVISSDAARKSRARKLKPFSLFEPTHGLAKLCVPGLTSRNRPLHTVHTATAPPATMTMASTYSPTANTGCLTG